MKILDRAHYGLASLFIADMDEVKDKSARVRHGLVAGWFSIVIIMVLFVIKMVLALKADSIAVIANAFHLLSHLANSIILVVTFKVTARPATAKNPFGHGRMEHIAPLIMAIFLFVSGIQIAESSIHQAIDPHDVHYFKALPLILLASIVIKQWLAGFVKFLGHRVHSHAIEANAVHHNIEAVMSLAVIVGLMAGNQLHHPEIDGYIGILVSLWIMFLGFTHARSSLVPLLGQAPSRNMIEEIRETAKSVEGIEDVHEIIVHDYGSLYLISAHAEIPEKFGPEEIHEVTERCERKLRKTYGGEVVLHSDPLMEKTPKILAMEETFKILLKDFPEIIGYHDFRVVAESRKHQLIIADIDVHEDVPESGFSDISKRLHVRVLKDISGISYCSFYVTPKFAY